MYRARKIFIAILISGLLAICANAAFAQVTDEPGSRFQRLQFDSIPDFPDDIGMAGPIVGVHNDTIIVAGGANFAKADDPSLWDLPKTYDERVWIFEPTHDGTGRWQENGIGLANPIAYSASVSTPHGVLSIGGENANGPTDQVLLLSLDEKSNPPRVVVDANVPQLPFRSTACAAALVNGYVYFVAGQVTIGQETKPSSLVYRLKVAELKDLPDGQNRQGWQRIPDWPDEGGARAHAIAVAQHDGFVDRLYVFGGRRFIEASDENDLNNLKFLDDVWSFDPGKYDENSFDPTSGNYSGESPWRKQSHTPVPVSAGTAVPFGPSHIAVLAYADGSRIKQSLEQQVEMKDFDHPGFPKTAFAYHTITDTWTEIGEMPAGQVTTQAVKLGDDAYLISGEIRPRVRTPKAWRIYIASPPKTFGWINMSVVIVYLLAMFGIGAFFTLRNKNTDDYFRGGKRIAWWVAGCSIFATMLSSITYMAVPAKAFAQNWVYSIGNVMILCVAPIAIYVALPFFRRIDSVSAYEYLEKRFGRIHRLISSGSFVLFHIFRMGVVLALAALALASVTPLSPVQCVIVMGVLSIAYCTLGGIEAVLWTDTIQTFVLIGGAILCLAFAFFGSEPDSLNSAISEGKFSIADMDFGSTSFATMAIWVVVLGGFGQNIASYTSDQAVVQRYMTTPDIKAAARSIWLNGVMSICAGLIFFGMGTAFWMFYRSHPEKLDPSIATDQIMPLFISQQLPVGLAGLVVAGIFAAAQSTVSTSMNSGASAFVTDFVKVKRKIIANGEQSGSLWLARIITMLLGSAGTMTGLLFVDPAIKSLFDQFISILGMLLGVIAGLFALGALTRRANSIGSFCGATIAFMSLAVLVLAAQNQMLGTLDLRIMLDRVIGFPIYQINGYLYALTGMTICFCIGYIASLLTGSNRKPLNGLTLWDR